MEKIHHDPKHPHQDREVPHMGKGPTRPYKIQKREDTPQKTNVQTEDNTAKTDIPTGQGFWYPPQIFTDPTYTVVMTHTEAEDMVKQETNFLGRYCEYCDECGETCCWCFSSDWEDELLNLDNPNSNPSVEMIPSPTVSRPPVGWSEIRHTIIRETNQTRPSLPTEEVSTDSGISMQ